MPVPDVCISPAFTHGPLGELTLANTRPAVCAWPGAQIDSANALRYDPAAGLWVVPAALPAPAGAASPLPVHLSSQGGAFSAPVLVATGSPVWFPSTADPPFANPSGPGTVPSTALSAVSVSNPSPLSMGFVGWGEWRQNVNSGDSDWLEMWGSLAYPGSGWPNLGSYLDAIHTASPKVQSIVHLRVRRAVVLTLAPGATAVVSAVLGLKNVGESGGTTAAQVQGWSWDLWGAGFLLDPIAQG